MFTLWSVYKTPNSWMVRQEWQKFEHQSRKPERCSSRFYSRGIIHNKFVPPGRTVNLAYYKEVLDRVLLRIRRVRPETLLTSLEIGWQVDKMLYLEDIFNWYTYLKSGFPRNHKHRFLLLLKMYFRMIGRHLQCALQYATFFFVTPCPISIFQFNELQMNLRLC